MFVNSQCHEHLQEKYESHFAILRRRKKTVIHLRFLRQAYISCPLHCTAYANTIGTMPVAGFRKLTGIGLKPMTVKCLNQTRHDRGSKLKLLPIPTSISAGFGGYVPTPTPVHISTPADTDMVMYYEYPYTSPL